MIFFSSCRMGKEINGGAWCPKPTINRDVYEYLQIDLGEMVVITMVGVQGRFGNGQVRVYKLVYRINTGIEFFGP